MNASLSRELLVAVKRTVVGNSPTLSIPVGRPVVALLRPVATVIEKINENDVQVLTAWRNRFIESFLSEFESDEDRTRRWLSEIVGPDDTRILFMVDAASGQTIGYMGLAFINWDESSGEADAIVRGGDAPRGLMTATLQTLLAWGRSQLGIQRFGVRVRSDNSAITFYRKFGFEEVKRVPLRRTTKRDMIQWVEDDSLPFGGPSLVHMTLPDEVALSL